MQITKAQLKKQMHVEDGEALEFLDVKMQISIEPGDTYEDIRSLLHKKLDRRFNELFAAELGIMPERMAEGDKWRQLGMFENV